MTKRMIFHIPQYIKEGSGSGSQIRPRAMLNAFKAIGYEVDVVMGYGEERKKAILNIKEKINSGVKYDFMYSESSTEPTLLTEKNHLPLFPFLDYSFFAFCKKNGIKIGLFYRDIYWQFDVYKKQVPLFKRLVATFFYHYDLYMYNKYLDVLFLPSKLMYDYIPFEFKGNVKELPPALHQNEINITDSEENSLASSERLNIFYVGGISELYNIEKLFQVVSSNANVELVVCCRKDEWENEKPKYSKYLNERITIIHKSGNELLPYYQKAHLLSLFMEPVEYRLFAMPVKLFEYLGQLKPIIASDDTAVGEFVERYDIGWSIEYSESQLNELLHSINENRKVLDEKRANMVKISQDNTWEARAKQVLKELSHEDFVTSRS